jgi:hypothetical protein
MLGQQRVFVDDRRAGIARLGEAGADPDRAERLHVPDLVAQFAPARLHRLALPGDPGATRRHRVLLYKRLQSPAKRRQYQPGRAGDRDIGGEAADRVAAEQRIDADMDDLALGRRRLAARGPRHVAIDDQDRIRLVEQGPGVVAEVTGMVRRQVQMPLAVLDDGNGELFGECREGRHRRAVAPGIGGDDDRVPRRRQ